MKTLLNVDAEDHDRENKPEKLALLIRDSFSGDLGESQSGGEPPASMVRSRDEAAEEVNASSTAGAKLALAHGSDVLDRETRDSFPSVLRLEQTLSHARRSRGAKIYSQLKSKDALQLVFSELSRRLLSPESESEAA